MAYIKSLRAIKLFIKKIFSSITYIYQNTYTFVGELITMKRTNYYNNFSSSNLVIQTNINYDRMGRKTGTKMIINNGSEVQTDSLEYNELGQLKTKRLHVNNDAGLEAINYAYNPRGWLTKAEGNYFKQKLYYDEIINNSTPQYNGNISVQTWGYNYSNQEKYYYDKLNRLTTYTNNSNNNETISYADKIGNIAKIIRAGSINETIIFSYIGNKIKRANNFEYFYNENGSVLNNGNIIISGYNELNLPNNISKTHASIFFTYNAKGEKVFKNEVGKEYRIYDDGLEFTRKNITEPYVLDIIKFEEGYIQNATNNFNFYYNLKDHIGNTRVSFMVNPNNIGNINQSIDYYAFGKVRIQGESAIKYLFNGNEYQTGLDVFDFNARTYDPTTGRFLQVDPNVEDGEQLGFNPYHFSFNNPIRYNDPDGLYPIYFLTRSYAPFKTFGVPGDKFYGDNRGNTLDRSASYRTLTSINYDTETKQTSAFGGFSRSHNERGTKDAISRTNISDRSKGNSIDVHSYGNNAAQTGSWDIDQFTKLKVTTDGNIKGNHILNVQGAISGDDFPNQESIIYDSKGNGLWLGNYKTSAGNLKGPTFDLARENEGDILINVNIRISVNKDGVFQGVMQKGKDGKESIISIGDWNKKFKSDDNK